MTPATRILRPSSRMDRAVRASARVAIVVVLAALGSLVSVAAAHAGPVDTEATAAGVHAKASAQPLIGWAVGGGWSSVLVQVVLWSIVAGLVVIRRSRTSTPPLE